MPKRGPGRPRKNVVPPLVAVKPVVPPVVLKPEPPRERLKQIFNLADGVKVTMEFWSDEMPDYNARQNFVTIATGAAKGAAGMEVLPSVGPARSFAGSSVEESRTNLTNMRGFGMTRGSMDPVEALKGIPGLTETEKAVQRTLDAVEGSVIESELGSIPDDDDLQPETLPS